jgi:hypothetical protein
MTPDIAKRLCDRMAHTDPIAPAVGLRPPECELAICDAHQRLRRAARAFASPVLA